MSICPNLVRCLAAAWREDWENSDADIVFRVRLAVFWCLAAGWATVGKWMTVRAPSTRSRNKIFIRSTSMKTSPSPGLSPPGAIPSAHRGAESWLESDGFYNWRNNFYQQSPATHPGSAPGSELSSLVRCSDCVCASVTNAFIPDRTLW